MLAPEWKLLDRGGRGRERIEWWIAKGLSSIMTEFVCQLELQSEFLSRHNCRCISNNSALSRAHDSKNSWTSVSWCLQCQNVERFHLRYLSSCLWSKIWVDLTTRLWTKYSTLDQILIARMVYIWYHIIPQVAKKISNSCFHHGHNAS